PPDLTLPLAVSRLSPRAETASDMIRTLQCHTWLALHGGPDMGKSQLALQVGAQHGQCRGWLRFHHAQAEADAVRHLDSALVCLSGWDRPPTQPGWYTQAVAAIATGGFIILDDLPRLTGDGPLAGSMIRLGQAARAAGVRILSTSQFELPSR